MSIYTSDSDSDNVEPTEDELMGIDSEEEETFTCWACGDTYPLDEAILPEDSHREFCRDCLEECDECGETFRYLSDHLENYCDSCQGYICAHVSMYWCDTCEEYSCENCGQHESCGSDEGIERWDYKPSPVFKGQGTIFTGFELEVSGSDSDIVPAVQQFDTASVLYMKRDGSHGVDVEIVSHPMTLDYARQYDFGRLLAALARNGVDPNPDNCGLHIHVNRTAFTSTRHRMAWLMLLMRNEDNLVNLARRYSDEYAPFKRIAPKAMVRKARDTADRNDSRYHAVNCTNRHTYELRFIGSTLDSDEFYAALELVNASVEYARGLSANAVATGALSWDNFRQYVTASGYAALARQMSVTA